PARAAGNAFDPPLQGEGDRRAPPGGGGVSPHREGDTPPSGATRLPPPPKGGGSKRLSRWCQVQQASAGSVLDDVERAVGRLGDVAQALVELVAGFLGAFLAVERDAHDRGRAEVGDDRLTAPFGPQLARIEHEVARRDDRVPAYRGLVKA